MFLQRLNRPDKKGNEIMTDFGNMSWHLYVILAYAASGIGFAVYALVQVKVRKETIESLKNEGFIDD